MTVEFLPGLPNGKIKAPPSKSMAHRLLICAALCEGESLIENISFSDDVSATLGCLEKMGCRIRRDENSVRITGIGRLPDDPGEPLDCGECGSTLRFLIPLCLCGNGGSFTGSDRLMARPLFVYERICAENDISFGNDGHVCAVGGGMKSGDFSLPGDISSQFVSGLLFALPLVSGDSRITLTGKIESRPYIDMTLEAMGLFGLSAEWETDKTLFVKGGQTGKPTDSIVPGDWSNAAFWYAFRSLGAELDVTGVSPDSLQGDRICVEYFKALEKEDAALDISDCPDLGPALFAVAAAKHGARFTGTRRLKIKESDRGAAMAAELLKFGVGCVSRENEMIVPGGIKKPAEPLDGHNDHRIVMALSCLLALTGGKLEGAGAVAKSYPDFFERLGELGAPIRISR